MIPDYKRGNGSRLKPINSVEINSHIAAIAGMSSGNISSFTWPQSGIIATFRRTKSGIFASFSGT
jgi:hypothetical protein